MQEHEKYVPIEEVTQEEDRESESSKFEISDGVNTTVPSWKKPENDETGQ